MGEKPMGREVPDAEAGDDAEFGSGGLSGHFEAVMTGSEAEKPDEPPRDREAKREADLADAEELDPLTGASGVNTTRSNIKSSAGAAVQGGPAAGDDGELTSDPIPDIDA